MLVGLEIWTYRDYMDVDTNSETTLDHFLLWRQADLLKRIKHDNAQFVTWGSVRHFCADVKQWCFQLYLMFGFFLSTVAKTLTETQLDWQISLPCVPKTQVESIRYKLWPITYNYNLTTGAEGSVFNHLWTIHLNLKQQLCFSYPGSPWQPNRPCLYHRSWDGT